jgi:tRNA threonylcarbamoyladenosine biosynthesis protein TsaB
LKTLAIESSAHTCSVALVENKILVCEIFSDSGLTHSQTLMSMISTSIAISKTDFSSIDSLSVSVGPGSYTGIRIGIAAAKGLSQPGGLKCFAVSTLEAIAYNFYGYDCIVCAVMDARCEQVYTALFKCSHGNVQRLTPDKAMSVVELIHELDCFGHEEPVILAGDGAKMFFELSAASVQDLKMAPLPLRFQRAYGVALCASSRTELDYTSSEQLNPVYLRAPQAERELKRGRNSL